MNDLVERTCQYRVNHPSVYEPSEKAIECGKPALGSIPYCGGQLWLCAEHWTEGVYE
jgi:hypothetical protein